jgi:hypothetical protein
VNVQAVSALLAALVAVVSLVGVTAAAERSTSWKEMTVTLSGAAERPTLGDADGRGTAWLGINEGRKRLCWEMTSSAIATATAAHIHVGDVNTAGPVIIPLSPTVNGYSYGCLDGVDDAILHDIKANPKRYYVNLHTTDFPGGAIRGQTVERSLNVHVVHVREQARAV